MLFLSTADLVLTSLAIMTGAGFASYIFLAYYPALGIVAVVLSSFWLGIAWTTLTAAIYTVACLAVDDGAALEPSRVHVLFSRVAVMYLLVVGIGCVSRFERLRWRDSVDKGRTLRQERIEV